MIYPCPVCGTAASLDSGCPGCSRPPDPEAAEVVRLNGELATLSDAVEGARRTYVELAGRLDATRRQRDELAGRVRARAYVARGSTSARASGPEPAASAPAPAVRGNGGEASPRTMQNVLFVLGGLLVGAAAIVFTGVAWATYGVGGRAVILAVLTLLTLTAPVLALRRGLRATAETFAAVGMLLVVLAGYAAWYVNLFGVGAWDGRAYAAFVCAVTAAVGALYGRGTGLRAAGFAALAAVQPIFPLLAGWLDAPATGWAAAFAGAALVDLAIARMAHGGLRVAAWLGYAAAQLVTGLCALVVLLADDDIPDIVAGVPLVLSAALVWVAGVAGRAPWLRAVGAAPVVPAAAIALARPAFGTPYLLVAVAAAVCAVALLTLALRGTEGRGARVGGWITAWMLGLAVTWLTAGVALRTADASLPMFTADGAVAARLPFDWQLPVAVALATVAAAALTPRSWWRTLATAGTLLVVFALPTAVPLPWWAVSTLDLVLVAALVLLRPSALSGTAAAVLAGHAAVVGLARPASAAAVFGAIAVLGLTAATVGARRGPLGAPSFAVGLAAVPPAAASAVYALVSKGPLLTFLGDGGAWPARIGTAAVVVAVVATFATRRGSFPAGYATAAALAVAAPSAVVGIWPELADLADPRGAYAATALLFLALTTVALRGHETPKWTATTRGTPGGVQGEGAAPAPQDPVGGRGATPPPAGTVARWVGPTAVPGPAAASAGHTGASGAAHAVPAAGSGPGAFVVPVVMGLAAAQAMAVALVAVAAPAATLVLAPYAWWGSIWSGRPSGVGLTPGGTATVPRGAFASFALLAAALLTVTATARGRREAGVAADHRAGAGARWGWAGAGFLAACGVLAGMVAAGAPWPVLPATGFAAGTALGLLAAVNRRATPAVPLAVVLLGSGGAGLLPTEAATLAGLGVVVLAGAVAGAVGADVARRVAGWLAALGAGLGFAVAAVRAADLPLHRAAFPVLAVATAALALGYLLRRRGGPAEPAAGGTSPGRRSAEALAVDVVGYAAAVPAVLLALHDVRYAAAVATVWGAVLAVRAVLPGERGRRGIAFAAAWIEVVAWWLLMASAEVALREAYTLPAAAVALATGLLAIRRTQGRTGSWVALGPGLAAALLPSLAAILVGDGQLLRRLLFGIGAVAVVLVGAHRRWQAPVAAGSLALLALAVHELVVWDLVPRWAYLAVGGLLLITVAMTYERRLRDLRRLRGALARMT